MVYMVYGLNAGVWNQAKKLATTDTEIGQITNIQYKGIYHFIVLQSAKLADTLRSYLDRKTYCSYSYIHICQIFMFDT